MLKNAVLLLVRDSLNRCFLPNVPRLINCGFCFFSLSHRCETPKGGDCSGWLKSMVAPLCWATTHSRGCIRDPERRSIPWRGVESGDATAGRESKKKREQEGISQGSVDAVLPGAGTSEGPEKSSGERLDRSSDRQIAGNSALPTGNGWRRQLCQDSSDSPGT